MGEEPVKTVKDLSGFDEGHVFPDGSVVVADKDVNGKVIGWHKAAPTPPPQPPTQPTEQQI